MRQKIIDLKYIDYRVNKFIIEAEGRGVVVAVDDDYGR